LVVQRGSFFLVAESLLVVAYSDVLRLPSHVQGESFRLRLPAIVLAVFGLLLTVLWAYDNIRQGYRLAYLRKRIEPELPEYRRTIQERKLPGGDISSTFIMALGIPILASIMWLIFVIVAV
jgi:hypothetical protein